MYKCLDEFFDVLERESGLHGTVFKVDFIESSTN